MAFAWPHRRPRRSANNLIATGGAIAWRASRGRDDEGAAAVTEVRIWVVGLGTVGQWVLRALHAQTRQLADRYGFVAKVVGVSARDGFVHDRSGLDLRAVIE